MMMFLCLKQYNPLNHYDLTSQNVVFSVITSVILHLSRFDNIPCPQDTCRRHYSIPIHQISVVVQLLIPTHRDIYIYTYIYIYIILFYIYIYIIHIYIYIYIYILSSCISHSKICDPHAVQDPWLGEEAGAAGDHHRGGGESL